MSQNVSLSLIRKFCKKKLYDKRVVLRSRFTIIILRLFT